MNKDELREQALLHMDSTRHDVEEFEKAARLFHEHVPLTEGQIVAAYWPLSTEFDVRYIMEDVMKGGGIVALPVTVRGSRELVFSKWDGKGDLVRGPLGVFVPPQEDLVEPDILLVPLLAFDRKGYRLGRGGGYYDATIAALRKKKDILAVGVGYATQAVLFSLPVEDHDQRMDMIITPQGVMDFRG